MKPTRPTLSVTHAAIAFIAAAAIGIVSSGCGGQEPPAKPPPPPAAPKDPPALSVIAQACARVTACTHAHDASRFRDPSACVDWWLSESDPKSATPEPLRKCLGDATNCDQVLACMHGGGDTRAATFCARPGVVSGCDGDRLVSCGEDDAHESSVVDCAAIGASCREVKSAGGLVVRACWSPAKCPSGAPEARCEGPNTVLSCRDGAFDRVVCRAGTTCEERKDDASGDMTASCELPNHRRCDARGLRHCEDDRLVECASSSTINSAASEVRNKTKVTDCVGFGLRCNGVGPRAGCSVPTNVECDKEMLPKCDGSSVVFCAAGRIAKVSCGAIGLGTCDPTAKGPIAACASRAPSITSSPAPATPNPSAK